ncbi:MAG: hypothetical protein J6D25_03835, partial [Eggerthellaceae bacterium]|nr:hypothetical protein [Eggerthellaceae bacterium]
SLEDLPDEKLLLPDSFVYAGLSDLIDGLVESQTRLVARAYYSDIDMLYLKVQTEGYVAFSSNMNNAMFGDNLAIVPVIGVDSTFSVSAFYSDALDDVTFVNAARGSRLAATPWPPRLRRAARARSASRWRTSTRQSKTAFRILQRRCPRCTMRSCYPVI